MRRLDVREDDPHAQHRLTVDDPGLGRKDFFVVRDADRDSTPDRPHLPRTDMASERAKITNHSLYPSRGLQVRQFNLSNHRIASRARPQWQFQNPSTISLRQNKVGTRAYEVFDQHLEI